MSNPLYDMIEAMTDAERKGAIAVLDRLTRPFTVREIEAHMRKAGLSRAQSEKAARHLRAFHIIAMIGPE